MLSWFKRWWLRFRPNSSPPENSPAAPAHPRTKEEWLARIQAVEAAAWWKDQTHLVAPTDEQLMVISPRSDNSPAELQDLGLRLERWRLTHQYVRHIWGLEDLLAGRSPRTPPIYLAVPSPMDPNFAEPVALVFVAAGTNHDEAGNSLAAALQEVRHRLAWFETPEAYSYYQR